MNKKDFKILVVDDDAMLACLICEQLCDRGFTAEPALCGQEALAKAAAAAYQLFIVDIHMPDMLGTDLLRTLDLKNKAAEAILITARESVDTAKQAVELGVFGYIGKPLDFDLLESQAGKALEMVSLKQEKERHLDNLEKLVHARTDQLEKLAHVNRISTMGEMAASLAHEINQPLASILNNAQASLRFLKSAKPDLEEVRNALIDIACEGNRAGAIIKGLRAFLRKEEPRREPLYLPAVIAEVLLLLRSNALMRTLSIENNIPSCVSLVRGSRVQVQQVIMNLIINACEAMGNTPAAEQGLKITVFEEDQARVVVEIADNGDGFKDDALQRVFEPFFTTKPTGLGMGLVIARSIIESHGGRLLTRNKPQKGALVSFWLPVCEAQA